MLFRPRLLLPLVIALGACDFFTLDEPEDSTGGAPATGGTGGSGATGGASGGSGGVGGATGGAGGVIGAGAGGTAGDTGTGGVGGTAGISTGGVGTGGVAGTAGEGAGMAGTGAAGAAAGGASGDGGTGGVAGSAGGGAGGGGGSGPPNCNAIQAQAYGGHCYLLNTGAATWTNARAECMSRSPGGHLVTITSQGEQDFVWGLAMQDAWMGATDGLGDTEPNPNGVNSTWITGEDIMQFNGWTSGEPNNYEKTCPSGSGTCYEHCGFMQMSASGAWNDDICGFEKPYLCEWDSGG